ncbi:MAG TPA: hypothetical protein VNT76_18040 [Candidatus Binatus sp.]|nr:hypothetical protein [Candidatus Binatus sp.]
MDGRKLMEIVNPVGIPRWQQSELAPRRYDSLRGRRIGLLDNNKPNADNFLRFIGELLQGRYPGIELVAKRKMTRVESDGLAELATSCDVVINAFAD